MQFSGGVSVGRTRFQQRFPEDFGAVRNGSTDDAAAIQAAIADAASACVADGSYYCEVLLSSGIYQATRATVKGGATLGNAQIPLPVFDPASGQKITVVLKGTSDAGAWVHWNQTVPQRSGAVIRSGLTGQTPDATWKSPSVIGGPTVDVTGSNLFSNMRLILDGITVMAPVNPSVIAADLRRVAQADIPNFSALADGTPATMANPTNDNGIGLYMPAINNNDSSTIGIYGCEGFYYGLGCSDHLVAQRLGLIYTNTAIYINAGSGIAVHGMSVLYASIEAAQTCIEKSNSAGNKYPIWIGRIDTETLGSIAIKDLGNNLSGYIGWASNAQAEPSFTGSKNVKMENVHLARGAIAAPAVPASTVATTPKGRDAAVHITGGTVTVVAVDGQATGLTSGMFIVPANKSIAVTYSVAPTWVWTLL